MLDIILTFTVECLFSICFGCVWTNKTFS